MEQIGMSLQELKKLTRIYDPSQINDIELREKAQKGESGFRDALLTIAQRMLSSGIDF